MEDALFRENDRTAVRAEGRQIAQLGAFTTGRGFTFDQVQLAYETWGTLNADRSNAILVCHALSGDSHAIGWWDRMVGPGKPIDTDRFYVICSNVLGGCQGSTGPSSPDRSGRPYGSRFPVITVEDMVEAQARLLDNLGIPVLHAVAGGSMGGMQALAWSVGHPHRVRRCFATASCAAHSAMQIALNEVGRQAIVRDPKWRGGDYAADDAPNHGLSLARMLGHISFLSTEAFDRKFGRKLQNKSAPDYHLGIEFEVESYLSYQGDKFTHRFDPNSQLILTRALDYFELSSFAGASARFLFVSYTSDWLYLSEQSAHCHRLALRAGCESEHHNFDLPYGHDAFLLDGELQGEVVRRFLD